MDVVEVSCQEYGNVLHNFTGVYNSPEFNKLNLDKAEDVKYLLFIKGKVRLGLIAGIKKNILHSPFSAPFGGFSCLKGNIGLEPLQMSVVSLQSYVRKLGLGGICITLPPLFYNESLISKFINSLYVEKFEISKIDLNYHFDISTFDENYSEKIWRNARKNLRISLAQGMTFRECISNGDLESAYNVILVNRQTNGYPLGMSFSQVLATSKVIQSHFFLVEFKDLPVASAIVFHVAPKIVQVIYWGDIPGRSELKPVNFLSFQIFQHFKNLGFKIIDIGPSTENSQPNFGLCEFKESIGCLISPKFSFRCLF